MTLFSAVKKAVAQNPEAILGSLGVQIKKHVRGEWTQAVCPICDDQNGSASISPEGFLKCHQCAAKMDIFEWVAHKSGGKIHAVAVDLAAQLHVEVKPSPKNRRVGTMPLYMSEELLDQAIDDLWANDLAEPARKFLADRKLDSDPVLLSELGVGWMKGYIVFAQREHNGLLQDRYRGYLPGGQLKWQWFGRGTGGPGIWLGHRTIGQQDKILLLEGEWDVLTALLRLRLHEFGWAVGTWTAGASSSPHLRDIPKQWWGRDVHICYDNDVFQGPDYANYWVKDKQSAGLEARRKNLLTKVGPAFVDAKCNVYILKVPIDPKVNWGADFRDWVDGGGVDVTKLPSWKLEELPPLTGAVTQHLDFDDVWDDHIGQRVSVRTQVAAIAGDDLIFPTTCVLKCQLGQLACCTHCMAPKQWPDGVIQMDQFSEVITLGIKNEDLEGYLLRHVVKRPKSCPEARISSVSGKPASYWSGVRPGSDDDTRQRTLAIISTQPPSLSGEVDASGIIYSDNGNVVLYADYVNQLDRAEVDLGYIQSELNQICPVNAESVEQIDEHLDYRWRDISDRVTRVFGRRDIHIACDLLYHSVAGINVGGKVRRGWLDIAMMGDTRTGKSMTIRSMADWLKLGSVHSAVDNVSRAGLIMGGDHNGMMRPGLLTKSHRKLLAMDEFHWLVRSKQLGEDHPMSWMQSARDEGKVFGVKIYGDRALPAKVRLLTISNWANSKRRTFTHACEHLGWLYGSPETLSRLDFGLIVEGAPSQSGFDVVPERFTLERTKALILRAWAQEPNQVIIEPDAEIYAHDIVSSWRHLYAYEKLPLYTPEEKPHSVLRIAASVANICFSHKRDDPYSVIVKEVHVKWAAEWLKHMWHTSGYDTYSRGLSVVTVCDSPLAIEKLFVVGLRLDDPNAAARIFSMLSDGVAGLQEINSLGFASDNDRNLFISKGIRLGAFTFDQTALTLNDQTHEIVQGLMDLSISDPDAYVLRARRLTDWERGKESKLVPIQLEA